jgi:hypothetical protein
MAFHTQSFYSVTLCLNELCGLCCRFHTSKSTWAYSASVSGCSYRSDNSTSAHPCPLLLAFRGQGLPDWAFGSSLLNCSSPSGNSCSLDVPSPPTNAWNFMTFRSLQPPSSKGTVEFNITIQLKGELLGPVQNNLSNLHGSSFTF